MATGERPPENRPEKRKVKVVVIGAGATGLVTAYLLARSGAEVTVVEGASRSGGLLGTFDVGEGQLLEHFYHHFFTHDAEMNWLLGELRLEDSVFYRQTSMGVFRDGRINPFDGMGDLLKFRPIGLPDRLRFGFSSAMLAYLDKYGDKEDVSCLAWFDRWAGRKATDAIWRPLLKIKFGDAAEKIPLAWMAGRLRQRARSRKAGSEQLGYIRGSLQVLVDRLVDELRELGGTIRTGTPVERLLVQRGQVAGVATGADNIWADRVVATVPTSVLADLVRDEDRQYAEQLDRIKYIAAMCTVLSLKEPLSPVYWTNVTDPGYDFGGVIEHTNFVPAEEYGGRHLVYLSRYLGTDDPLWSMDDDRLLDRQLNQLGKMYGRNVRPLLERSWIFRARHGATMTDMGFHEKIPRMDSPLKNLLVASMCHIYPDERSVNNSIRVAAEAVRHLNLEKTADEVPRGLSFSAKYAA